jgi:hypothetical protein
MNLFLEITLWLISAFGAFLLFGVMLILWIWGLGWWYGWTKNNPHITPAHILVLLSRRKEL